MDFSGALRHPGFSCTRGCTSLRTIVNGCHVHCSITTTSVEQQQQRSTHIRDIREHLAAVITGKHEHKHCRLAHCGLWSKGAFLKTLISIEARGGEPLGRQDNKPGPQNFKCFNWKFHMVVHKALLDPSQLEALLADAGMADIVLCSPGTTPRLDVRFRELSFPDFGGEMRAGVYRCGLHSEEGQRPRDPSKDIATGDLARGWIWTSQWWLQNISMPRGAREEGGETENLRCDVHCE
jgi:hypothetical protein